MSAEQIARCERRIAELGDAGPTPAAAPSAALKVAAVALVALPLALFGLSEAMDVERPLGLPAQVEAPLPSAPSAPSAPSDRPAPEEPPAVSVDTLPSAGEDARPAPKRVEPRAAQTPLAPADRLARELALLDRARTMLGTDPAAALRDVDRHAHEFADGQLVAEREVIAVDALRRLGRMSEARARGKAFSERAPGTSAARRIDSLLELTHP